MAFVDDVLEAETRTGQIKIHSEADFEGMRVAGRLAAECLDMLVPHVVPGVSTEHLDRLAREFILDHGALPACLFYKGYSHTVCISPNHRFRNKYAGWKSCWDIHSSSAPLAP